jgi:hypothetical protein
MIRGGQGRSARQVRDDAQALGWFMLALVVVVALNWGCRTILIDRERMDDDNRTVTVLRP